MGPLVDGMRIALRVAAPVLAAVAATPGLAASPAMPVFAAPAPHPGAQEEGGAAVLLRLGGSPGEWMRYRHRSDLVVELPEDLGGPAITRTTIGLLHSIEGVSERAIDYLTTIEEVTFEVRPRPPELPDLGEMRDLRFSHTAARDGRTTRLRLPGSGEPAGPGFVEQVENWLGQLGFPLLPEGAVAVGVEWSESRHVAAQTLGLAVDVDVLQSRSIRLAEVLETPSGNVAVLDVRTRWISSSERRGAGGAVASIRGSAEQTVRFDLGRGRFLGSTGERELELVLTPAGTAQYVAVRAGGRHVTELIGTGADRRPGEHLRE